MTNLDIILISKDIILPTKVHIVKVMVFPVVMYECESWTIKKSEHRRTDAFELWCWRRLLRVLWTARAQNIKNLPAMQETLVQSLGWEDSMEKGMVTHCSILAWRIPWTEEPGGLQTTGVTKNWTHQSN